MKTNRFLLFLTMVVIFICAVLIPGGALAQSDPASSISPAPEWLSMIIGYLSGIPAVGPILARAFGIAALVSAVMTALSVFLQAILTIPEIVARFSGAHALANKIKHFSDKALPWVKYLSMFNVQKKPGPGQ